MRKVLSLLAQSVTGWMAGTAVVRYVLRREKEREFREAFTPRETERERNDG